MLALPLALALAAAPQVNLSGPQVSPQRRALEERLHLDGEIAQPTPCPELGAPLDGDVALQCAPPAAHFARAVWRSPRPRTLRVQRVSVAQSWAPRERPELPSDRAIAPYAAVQVRFW
ncbi:MAG: hypothetical protein JST54_14650 [Deltaproteobacteria bacterium]|nr:hypothetical protein [Deltaproteobacteria bacterium]